CDGEDRVLLSVRDSGVGFAPNGTDRLFDPFYTTKPDGVGFGRWVCRAIIENSRGRLWAAPNEGPGVTFAFSVPSGPGVIDPGGATPLSIADTAPTTDGQATKDPPVLGGRS